jgi:NADH dehydrogenase [ubiquinone] 1 alpha subcomplex assembly factor 1
MDPEHFSPVLPMFSFPTAESILDQCALGSDNDTGGYSVAKLEHGVDEGVSCLKFSGELSLHVSPEAKKRGITHSGWAGWRTKPVSKGLFGGLPLVLGGVDCSTTVWDTSLFRFLQLKVKGDDRRYYVNVQTDSMDPLELWQHRLFLRSPGEWETVLIPWGDFLRTRNGRVTYKKLDGIDRERIKTVGASLIERREGPFCLEVAHISVSKFFCAG